MLESLSPKRLKTDEELTPPPEEKNDPLDQRSVKEEDKKEEDEQVSSEERRPDENKEDSLQQTKVYVSNLDYRTTETELLEFFQQWGTVQAVCLPKHPLLQRSRGFAFVEFETAADSELAIKEMNGKEYDGRTLMVSRPADKDKPPGECKFFKSATGCFNGAGCRFLHTGAGKVVEPPRPARRFYPATYRGTRPQQPRPFIPFQHQIIPPPPQNNMILLRPQQPHFFPPHYPPYGAFPVLPPAAYPGVFPGQQPLYNPPAPALMTQQLPPRGLPPPWQRRPNNYPTT